MYYAHLSLFVFFKQKRAYETRISDWSSDVCSSDLHVGRYAQRSTQRCHIALPSRLATMEPQRSNLIEFERIARSEAQHRLPIKNGIAFGFLDELARIRRKLPFDPTRIRAVCIFRLFARRRADRKRTRLNSSH